MQLWESSLATRDGVFGLLAVYTALAVLLYRLLPPRFQAIGRAAAVGVLLGLFIFSLWNIATWTPA